MLCQSLRLKFQSVNLPGECISILKLSFVLKNFIQMDDVQKFSSTRHQVYRKFFVSLLFLYVAMSAKIFLTLKFFWIMVGYVIECSKNIVCCVL